MTAIAPRSFCGIVLDRKMVWIVIGGRGGREGEGGGSFRDLNQKVC